MTDAYLSIEDEVAIEKTPPSRLEFVLKRAAIALAVILVAELVWFFLFLPCFPFAKIEISGADSFAHSELLAIAEIGDTASYFSLSTDIVERILESEPRIASAVLTKRFPDTLHLEIIERSMVGVALTKIGGRTVPALVDATGVVFRAGGEDDADFALNALDLVGPVVSGACLDQAVVGTRLPDAYRSLFQALGRLRQEAPALLDAISEIRVEERAYESFELTLYPSHYAVRVKMGPELNEESLRYMMLLLDVLKSKGIGTDELDFRTGTATYRVKEASSD